MATYCSLLNVCVSFCILLTWCNNFVTTSDELENMDSEQSDNKRALTPLQIKLLEKWHINVNISNLIDITNENINSPTKMTRKLLRMILGKELLSNAAIKSKTNSFVQFNPIPDNVKNFVFEYVNLHATSSIDISTFSKTVTRLCSFIRKQNRYQLLKSGDDGTLTRLQKQLLQKWSINVNDEILMNITRKYNDRPNIMIIELLKMILGHNFLKHMAYKNVTISDIKNEIIPKNVQAFILEHVNLHTKSNIDLKNLCTLIRKNINHLRHKLKSRPLMKDSEPLNSQTALTPLKMELLEKWHINVNIESLINITNINIDSPTKMTLNLLRMILGKELLSNMTMEKKTNSFSTLNPIPNNVKNFVFEYVNRNAKSGIDNSTFTSTVNKLCSYLRIKNKNQLLWKGDEGTLTPLQEQLLQKWNINASDKILNYITWKYIDRPKMMISELLKMILGDNILENMAIKNMNMSYITNKIIPPNVQNFMLEYVNLHTKLKADPKSLIKIIRQKINNLRNNLNNTMITTDALPDLSLEELEMNGIEFQDADLDMSNFLNPVDFT